MSYLENKLLDFITQSNEQKQYMFQDWITIDKLNGDNFLLIYPNLIRAFPGILEAHTQLISPGGYYVCHTFLLWLTEQKFMVSGIAIYDKGKVISHQIMDWENLKEISFEENLEKHIVNLIKKYIDPIDMDSIPCRFSFE